MEIKIPVAGQDSTIKSLPTNGTGCQKVPDSWSQEGLTYTTAVTARMQSGVSHAKESPPQDAVAESESTDNTNAELGIYEDAGTSSLRSHAADGSSLKRVSGSDITSIIDEDASRTRLVAEEIADRYLTAPSSDSQDKDSGSQIEDENRPPESQDLAGIDDAKQVETTSDLDKEADAENNADWVTQETEACDEPGGDADNQSNHESDRNNGAELQDTLAGEEESNVDPEEKTDENGNLGTWGTGEGGDDTEDGEADHVLETENKENGEESERVFITENHNMDEDGSLSDIRADTPNWEERDRDVNDTASLSDIQDFTSLKRARSSARSRVRPTTRSTIREDIASGHRAVANTPVSYYTIGDGNAEACRHMESRNTSHAGLESAHEAVFQQAMTLMSNRCVSVQGAREGSLYSSAIVPYGPQVPEYFYVQQQKPATMPPLKAWRGYHGNVYFEPIQINRVGGKGGDDKGQADLLTNHRAYLKAMSRKSSSRRTNTPARNSRALVPVDNGEENSMFGLEALPVTRSTTRQTSRRGAVSAKSLTSSVGQVSQHHMLYLDKNTVINPENTQMREELQVMEKQQSTGSLAIHMSNQDIKMQQRSAGGYGAPAERNGKASRRGAKSAKFNRICKGSVAHHLHRVKSGNILGHSNRMRSSQTAMAENGNETTTTQLLVIGDRFTPPTVMSPLLRTQTQYSLSSQRMTMNSPDLYGAFERLPPLEQVRISLRHMDAQSEGIFPPRNASPYSTGGSIGVMEDLKPFIKYSPDVRAQYNRQIKYY